MQNVGLNDRPAIEKGRFQEGIKQAHGWILREM